MEKDFFIGIYEPVDVRRNLLEASQEIVGSLQAYERLEMLRNEKLRHFLAMRELISELDMLVSRLKKALPRTDLRKAIQKPILDPSAHENNSPAEMRKIEDQIRKIEKEFSQIKL